MRVAHSLMAAAALALLAGAAQANTRLVVNCFWPPQHYVCQSILPTWLEWVEEATEGRVRGIIPPKTVAAPPEQWDSVEKGIVDVAPQFNGFVQNRVQGPLVAMNLFVSSKDAVAMSQALWETYEQFYPDEYEGVHLLSTWVITPGSVYSQTDTPILSMDELINRKIWALPGASANLLKKLGSGVVAGPAVQANEIISRGVVDGYIALSPTSLQSFQLIPYTKSMTRFSRGMYTTSFSLLINEDKWAEISPEDQAAIMEVSGPKFGRMAAQEWHDADERGMAAMQEAGIELHDAPAEFENALIEASQPLTEAWIEKASAKGLDAAAMLEFYTSRLQELTAANQ